MESNNNPTTIGGVTFGGAPAPQGPVPQAPTSLAPQFPASQPLSPQASAVSPSQPASTVPPDVALNNFAAEVQDGLQNQPVNPAGVPAFGDTSVLSPVAAPSASSDYSPSYGPTAPTTFTTPADTLGASMTLTSSASSAAPASSTSAPSALSSATAAPTAAPEIPQVSPLPSPSPFNPVPRMSDIPESADSPEKSSAETIKKLTILSIVFGILAIGFMIFSIIILIVNISTSASLNDTETKLKNARSIIAAVEQSSGMTITSPADVPAYKATTGYIYVNDWNIKFKIPDDLTNVSYILNQNDYHPSICFNAAPRGVQYFPPFANIALNPGRMGCLTRIPTAEGNFDRESGIGYGELVYTYKGYNFFYTGATDFSSGENAEAELALEHTADQLIKNMLTDNIESYE